MPYIVETTGGGLGSEEDPWVIATNDGDTFGDRETAEYAMENYMRADAADGFEWPYRVREIEE